MPATITGNQTGTVGLINAGTAQNSTSGTAIDFTGIPAGVKRITIMFSGVSTSGTSATQIQIGSGSVDTTATYLGAGASMAGTNVVASLQNSTGFLTTGSGAATHVRHGISVLSLVTGNTWAFSSTTGHSDGAQMNVGGGSKSLSGTLDRVRITTVNGTDTFDAGSINILYE